jgi:hypothetical protein
MRASSRCGRSTSISTVTPAVSRTTCDVVCCETESDRAITLKPFGPRITTRTTPTLGLPVVGERDLELPCALPVGKCAVLLLAHNRRTPVVDDSYKASTLWLQNYHGQQRRHSGAKLRDNKAYQNQYDEPLSMDDRTVM